jgi:hypothetical protein
MPSPSDLSLQELRTVHQRFDRVALSEVVDPQTGQMAFVSTVLIACGESFFDGWFAKYETRIFGGRSDQRSWEALSRSEALARHEHAVSVAST